MATKEFEFHIESDETDEVIRQCTEKVKKALETIGIKAEGYAQGLCPVDTGLLRNSITHAVSGNPTSITTYTADREKNGKLMSGSYSGTVGSANDNTVYVGTNVEYAVDVELGIKRKRPKPYIKPSIQDHISDYKTIIEQELKR